MLLRPRITVRVWDAAGEEVIRRRVQRAPEGSAKHRLIANSIESEIDIDPETWITHQAGSGGHWKEKARLEASQGKRRN